MRRRSHGPKLVAVTTYRLQAALPEPLGWTHGVKTTAEALLVRVETEGGSDGWGECAGPPGVVEAAIHEVLAPAILGQDGLQTDVLWHRGWNALGPWGRRGAGVGGLSGVDMALWDLKGHVRRCPASELFGGRFRERISCAATGLYFREGPETERIPSATAEARRLLESGNRAITIQLGRSVSADIALIRRLREALPDATLLAEAHGGFDLPEAIAVGRALDDASFAGFNDPLSPDGSEAEYPTLAGAIRTPVLSGGTAQTRFDVASAGRAGWQVNLAWCGGPTEAMRIRAVCHAAGLNVAPRTIGATPLGLAAAIHFLASDARQPGRAESPAALLEREWPHSPLERLPAFSGLHLEDGVAQVPWTFGWGVVVDPEGFGDALASETRSE